MSYCILEEGALLVAFMNCKQKTLVQEPEYTYNMYIKIVIGSENKSALEKG